MLLSFPNMISNWKLCKSFGKKFICRLENDTQPLVENDYIMDRGKKFVLQGDKQPHIVVLQTTFCSTSILYLNNWI